MVFCKFIFLNFDNTLRHDSWSQAAYQKRLQAPCPRQASLVLAIADEFVLLPCPGCSNGGQQFLRATHINTASSSSKPKVFVWAETIDGLQRFNVAPSGFTGAGTADVTHAAVGAIAFNTEGKALLVQRATNKDIPLSSWHTSDGTVDMEERIILHSTESSLPTEISI